jgi:hypothetical protein
MVVVSKQNIGNILLLEAFGELHQVQEKLRFFQEKYQHDFVHFSRQLQDEDENFEHFDDYIEWKAYTKLFHETKKKIEDLKHGNFQIN